MIFRQHPRRRCPSRRRIRILASTPPRFFTRTSTNSLPWLPLMLQHKPLPITIRTRRPLSLPTIEARARKSVSMKRPSKVARSHQRRIPIRHSKTLPMRWRLKQPFNSILIEHTSLSLSLLSRTFSLLSVYVSSIEKKSLCK